MTANTLVQGQRVKGQGHSVLNSQHRFTAKCVSFFTYLARERVEKYAWWAWLQLAVARRNFAKRPKTIFSNQTNPKTQNVWRDVVRPSRCNAFAIAGFLVLFLFVHSTYTSQTETDLGMFSMFGRTGAPIERGPHKSTKKIIFLQHGNKPEILK